MGRVKCLKNIRWGVYGKIRSNLKLGLAQDTDQHMVELTTPEIMSILVGIACMIEEGVWERQDTK